MAELGVEIKLDRKAIESIAGRNDMEKGLQVLTQIGETEAKARAPVDTGNLRRSITHEVEKEGIGWVGRYGTNVRYAIFQEVGTIRHPAQPFLRPALEAIRNFLSR